jgi:hypothetical protein
VWWAPHQLAPLSLVAVMAPAKLQRMGYRGRWLAARPVGADTYLRPADLIVIVAVVDHAPEFA